MDGTDAWLGDAFLMTWNLKKDKRQFKYRCTNEKNQWLSGDPDDPDEASNPIELSNCQYMEA